MGRSVLDPTASIKKISSEADIAAKSIKASKIMSKVNGMPSKSSNSKK
jgi:hypothetical protein